MQKTRIEWVKNPDGSQGYTWNPIRGLCPVACFYCYARKTYKRFKWDEKPWLNIFELNDVAMTRREGKRIFVCSTFDLFHPVVDGLTGRAKLLNGKSGEVPARDLIFDVIWNRPDLTFIVLTKLPERIDRPMPPNVWLGVSVTNAGDWGRFRELMKYRARVRFVSMEPLIGSVPPLEPRPDWLIVGRLTGHGRAFDPRRDQLLALKRECETDGIPLFMKNNLAEIWGGKLIQEFPDRPGSSGLAKKEG